MMDWAKFWKTISGRYGRRANDNDDQLSDLNEQPKGDSCHGVLVVACLFERIAQPF